MINILPPDVKKQLNFSKRNTVLLRRLLQALAVLALLAGVLVYSFWYSSRQITDYETALSRRQADREAYKDVEAKVQTLQSNLGLIEKLLNEKNQFSSLLDDFASALPPGSYINQLTLTGKEKEPLELVIIVDSFNKAAQVRTALINSDRIKSADIQNIAGDEKSGKFTVTIIASFEAGKAR